MRFFLSLWFLVSMVEMINEHVDDKCPAKDKNSAKIHKGTSLAHNLPFPLQREGVSTAEHGPLLYTVNSLKETTGDQQKTQSGRLLVDSFLSRELRSKWGERGERREGENKTASEACLGCEGTCRSNRHLRLLLLGRQLSAGQSCVSV